MLVTLAGEYCSLDLILFMPWIGAVYGRDMVLFMARRAGHSAIKLIDR